MKNKDYKEIMSQLIEFDIENKIDRVVCASILHFLEKQLLKDIKEDFKNENSVY